MDNGLGENKMMLLKLDKALYRIILGCGIMLEIGLWFGNSLFQIGWDFGYWVMFCMLDGGG